MILRYLRKFLGRSKSASVLSGTPNFSAHEFRCRDGSDVPPKYRHSTQVLMWQLEELRSHLGGVRIRIVSGYRSPKYNKRISGAKRSKHMLGQAADIRVDGYTPKQVADAIEELILLGHMRQGGLGRYPRFTHYDIRPSGKARWGSNQ